MVVGLYEKRLKLQHIEEQVLCSIHYKIDSPPGEPCHYIPVDGIRHAGGNTSGEHQGVSAFQLIELRKKTVHGFHVNVRAHSVDLGSVKILQLNVDS